MEATKTPKTTLNEIKTLAADMKEKLHTTVAAWILHQSFIYYYILWESNEKMHSTAKSLFPM